MDEQLHTSEIWDLDGQENPERACSDITTDEQLHLTEQWDYYGQTDPEKAGSNTRAVAGSDSMEWETRHAEAD